MNETMDWKNLIRGVLMLAAVWVGFPAGAGAYSVLSHEEVVDMAWLPRMVPLLKARYPGLTDDQLREAHGYAYGGSVIQDMGYYPFGSKEFSDIVHYARTGDFVSTLIRDASNADEYAFALGALAHYCGDVDGHPAINQVTADEYPKLKRRFGPVVTYGEDPIAHLRTEFGFDVVEVAHGRYSQENYRDFIGFQVAKELLNRAFEETYGVPVSSILKHEDLAIGTYRRSVSTLIPKMTTVALASLNQQIEKESPGFDHKKFVYRLRRTEYEKSYGRQYTHPGVGARMVAFVVKILPKVGPLRALRLKVPDAQEQDVYLKSVNHTVDTLDGYLQGMAAGGVVLTPVSAQAGGPPSAPASAPDLKEIDLDTGKPATLGEYELADKAYAKLLDRLVNQPGAVMSEDLRQSFVDFYGKRVVPAWYAKKRKQWARVEADLKKMDAAPDAPPVHAAMPSGN